MGSKILSPNNPIPLMRSQVPYWTQVGSKLVKQWNCLEFEALSQLSALKRVEGRAEPLRWDQEEGQVLVTYSNLHQTNQQVGQFTFWSTFSARTSHGQPWMHKTHHGPDSSEATTFPIQYYLRLSVAPTSEQFFVPGLPRRSSETILVWTPRIL